jgi:hypothetical protein
MTQRKRRLKVQARSSKTKRDLGYPFDQQWVADPSSRRAVDAHHPLFRPWFPEITDDDIKDLELNAQLAIPQAKRGQVMLGLDVAFDVLTVYMHEAGRPPPHEMRNRMTSVRNDLHKILKRLGVKPELLDMKTWHPSALDLNPNIMSELVDGANDDRDLVYSCIRAMGALADIADEARRKAEYRITNAWSVGAARIAFAQKLMDAHESIFQEPPTETRNGKWHNFATCF